MKKRNNKGFSLVELIVVMAIMAILAVAITPQLTEYIDKARQTNDREIVNAVYTAIKYALLDEQIVENIEKTNDPVWIDSDGDSPVDILAKHYEQSTEDGKGDVYNAVLTGKPADKLSKEIYGILGDSVKLQSKYANTLASKINVCITNLEEGKFYVELIYGDDSTITYKLDSSEYVE